MRWVDLVLAVQVYHTYPLISYQDNKAPVITQIVAPHYPWFRPSDSAYLVKRFKFDNEYFEYFDWSSYNWFEGDNTTPRRNVLTCGDLHFRSLGVVQAPDMPSGLRVLKRAGTELTDSQVKHSL